MSTPETAPGERSTRQKRALAEALAAAGEFRSAQSLHAALRESGARVGLTTVYGQLRALADAGEVDTIRSTDGEVLYRRCGTRDHHHHLVCRVCGRAVEIEGPEVETWAARVAKAARYTDVEHTLEITGICRGCR
jgi:Fur family ferric uptake transcriptional regulator